ncbi:MAG: NAD(P)/FAD-dependent oxidoreductase [Pseudomonadota bacterium]|nr:NAD(P)/FAD-dependent oxidoreductase [Pseudomonadota bacterium]
MPTAPESLPTPTAATDCIVVGASFAGLASAWSLARRGLRVTVLEKKSDPGARLHTTGILVKDAVDQIALLDALPASLVRRVPGVRLYAPNLRHVDLDAPGYYFLATDTPGVMRWLAAEAERAGATIRCGSAFTSADSMPGGFDVAGIGHTRFLIGADGPRSRVAQVLNLGRSTRFLTGIEYEYTGAELAAPDRLHCFIDGELARGYIGWVVAGVEGVQAGLAQREGSTPFRPREAMQAFLAKIAPVIDLRDRKPDSVRAGLIPCGGVVSPSAGTRALLVGDAAGMVSPLTAGGIHAALKHGLAAGHAVADFLAGRAADPAGWFVDTYPRYRTKRLLRLLFDHFQSDTAFNLLLASSSMRMAASVIYFHQRGVFSPPPPAQPPRGLSSHEPDIP